MVKIPTVLIQFQLLETIRCLTQEKVAQLAAKGKPNTIPKQQKLDFYQQVVDEETARIDRDYPGGTTFDFADYEQDTGGDVGGGTGTMSASRFF